LFSQRPIIHRHQKAAMYHPFIESLASFLVDIPITFVTIALFTIVLYFVVQLQQTPAQYFIFFLIVSERRLGMGNFFFRRR
jgi:ATP-binding cassette subfamily G (WHITE) protein 2 (SNQ2)